MHAEVYLALLGEQAGLGMPQQGPSFRAFEQDLLTPLQDLHSLQAPPA